MILGVENRTGSFVMEVHPEWVRRRWQEPRARMRVARARTVSVSLNLVTRLRKDHGSESNYSGYMLC